jgi:hypothetical protein
VIRVRIEKSNQEIRSIDDWFRLSPPKRGEYHWKDGRSAKELARAYFRHDGPSIPEELADLLAPLLPTGSPIPCAAYPEHKVAIDELEGEPPNIDLALAFGEAGRSAVAACVEGKADEPFGDPVSIVLTDTVARIARDERTGVVTRVQRLLEALLPSWSPGQAHAGDLRYQLLTGVAATLAFAKLIGARTTVFAVHEFIDTEKTKPENLARNADDLNRFVHRLTNGRVAAVDHDKLVGPIGVPTAGDGVQLYIGKVSVPVTAR